MAQTDENIIPRNAFGMVGCALCCCCFYYLFAVMSGKCYCCESASICFGNGNFDLSLGNLKSVSKSHIGPSLDNSWWDFLN